MKKLKIRPVEPSESNTYWRRSEDCWDLAHKALQEGKWAGCAINVIPSVIALADLMCIRYAGKRYAGTSHDESVDFYATLDMDDPDFQKSVVRLGQILSVKTDAEYGGSPLGESHIRQMMKLAERFRSFVLNKIGK